MSLYNDERQETAEDRLLRWSRRKLQAGQAPQVPTTKIDEKAAAVSPPMTDADMPSLESLSENSDFSGFMSSGISDELQRLALRKLFHLPGFCIRDGLDDYDEDFRSMPQLMETVTSRVTEHIRHGDKASPAQADQKNQADAEDGVDIAETEASVREQDDLSSSTVMEMADEDKQKS